MKSTIMYNELTLLICFFIPLCLAFYYQIAKSLNPKMSPTRTSGECATCHNPSPGRHCERCRDRAYCSRACQRADWSSHKRDCKPHAQTPRNEDAASLVPQWYDRYRKCKDGNRHEGRLELITWEGSSGGEKMGWGNCIIEDCGDLKRKFEDEFGGDEKRMYDYWPQGFRWTCCGLEGDSRFGCDHHGAGTKPCSCDFCQVSALVDRAKSGC